MTPRDTSLVCADRVLENISLLREDMKEIRNGVSVQASSVNRLADKLETYVEQQKATSKDTLTFLYVLFGSLFCLIFCLIFGPEIFAKIAKLVPFASAAVR